MKRGRDAIPDRSDIASRSGTDLLACQCRGYVCWIVLLWYDKDIHPYEYCVRGRRESPPGSDAEITLDLIRDLAVDRKQTGLIELRLSNVQSRFVAVVITECQFQQFPAPHSQGEQQDYRKPSQFGRSGGAGFRFKCAAALSSFSISAAEKMYGLSR
jgi:hypothetical protein